MNRKRILSQRAAIISVAAFVILAAGAAFWLRAGNTAARAGSPPPDQPQFDGISVSESFPIGEWSNRPATSRAPVVANGWEVVFSEDWEAGFDDATWLTLDRNGTQGGEYKWDVREFENTLGGGQQSAWAIGGGQDGQNLNVADGGYPANADSWLIYGPVDMSQALDAELSFNYWFEADAGDEFSVLVSSDGTNWEGKQTDNGGTGEWFGRNYALDTYVGEPTVYVAFRFASNENGDPSKLSAFVDDVEIRADFGNKQYLPHIQVQPSPTATATVTPTPTPTATPPSGIYLDDFTNDISGWESRRARSGANYAVNHRSDSDGGRQGQLEISLSSQEGFVIVSPLVQSKAPPYNIEVYAKLKEPKDRQMYGIVFGADWNGSACAAPSSPNCFTRYYELRVQYRDFGGQRFQEVKLKRIESHDGNGEPEGPTLIDWKKGGNVNADDWVEIDINVTADGKIRISWNGKFIAETQDATLLSQRYFGLMLITKENGNARVKYDYIKID